MDGLGLVSFILVSVSVSIFTAISIPKVERETQPIVLVRADIDKIRCSTVL